MQTKPILILALNPCVDVEWRVNAIRWDEKTSVLAERRWAGGKGVNVARWLRFLKGRADKLLVPLGGQAGTELAGYLRQEKLPFQTVHLGDGTRANVLVTSTGGNQLRFNPLGPKISTKERRELFAVIGKALQGCSAVILSGSLPRGLPATAYAVLINMAHATGVPALVDCDGAAFAAAVRAKPFLVKPNRLELQDWFGKPIASEAAVLKAAKSLSEATGNWVLVSGGARPSYLENAGLGVRFTQNPSRVTPLNTLGAGDAMLAAAAWQIQLRASPVEWLRWGVAAGTAATQCSPGKLPNRQLMRRLSESAGLA